MSTRLPGLYPTDVEVSAIPEMPSNRIVTYVGQFSNGPTDRPFMVSRDDLSSFRPLSDVSGEPDYLFLAMEETLKVAQYVYCARVATETQSKAMCALGQNGGAVLLLESRYCTNLLNNKTLSISTSPNEDEIVVSFNGNSYNLSVNPDDDNYLMYLNDYIPEVVLVAWSPTAVLEDNPTEAQKRTYYNAIKAELVTLSEKFVSGSAGYVSDITAVSEDFSNACKLLEDKEICDPFLIMSPGITSANLIKMLIDIVATRSGDCKVAIDCKNSANVDTIITELASVKSMYAEAFAGWGVYYDKYLKKDIIAPPTVAYGRAFIEAVDIKYFGSVAGTNRGVLNAFKGLATNFTYSGKIKLKEACINPIILKKSLPTVYDNLTMVKKTSVFSDTNVTNIHVTVKKAILESTDSFVFEDNNSSTWARWKTMMTPIMDEIYQKGGFYAYQLLMGIDDGTMKDVDIDIKVMRGVVKYKPTREASYVEIPFAAYSYGTSFDSE